MADREVEVTVATTHRIEKYGGIRMGPQVLTQLVDRLNRGELPMVWEHSTLERLPATNMEAWIERLEDGESAVRARFTIDAQAWATVEAHLAATGAPGGFSFTAGELQSGPEDGLPLIMVSADAAGFSDSDRAEIGERLTELAPTQLNRLYEFSATHDVVRLIVEYRSELVSGAVAVGLNVLASAIWDSVKGVLRRQPPETESVVELRRLMLDGTQSTAVVRSGDPEIIRMALEAAEQTSENGDFRFDCERGIWLPHGSATR